MLPNIDNDKDKNRTKTFVVKGQSYSAHATESQHFIRFLVFRAFIDMYPYTINNGEQNLPKTFKVKGHRVQGLVKIQLNYHIFYMKWH